MRGVPSVGFEAHHFLAQICRAKLLVDSAPEIIHEIQYDLSAISLRDDALSEYSSSAKKFLLSLLPEESLKTLAVARERVETYQAQKAFLAHLILSKVLELASHSKTDGIYKAPTSKKTPMSYLNALNLVCDLVAKDLALSDSLQLTNKAELHTQSSENMSPLAPHTFDLLITSPPYLNNFDFAEMTRMYLYFWKYAESWKDITEKVRSKLIVNTTTALKGHKDKLTLYRTNTPAVVRKELDHYQSMLSEKRRSKPGKKEYDYLIYPYFAQMTKVLSEAYRTLKDRAKAHIVISDAALYGVHIRTHEILARILEAIGFKDVEIERLRHRGQRWILEKREGAESGLGEFEIRALANHIRA